MWSFMSSFLRGAEAHAGADEAVAAAAGSKPEDFHLTLHSSQDCRELGWSQTSDPQTAGPSSADLQTDPGQTSHYHTEAQDTSL